MNFSDLSQTVVQNPLVVSSGLVGYWSFNDGGGSIARDFSGNKLDGSLINSPDWTTGRIGSSLSFSSSRYVLPKNPLMNVSTNVDYTLSAWINPNFNSASNDGNAVFGFSSAGVAFTRTYIRWEGPALGWYADSADNVNGTSWKTGPMTGSNPSFTSDSWHFLQFVHFGASNTAQFYWDSVPITTIRLAFTAKTVNNQPLYIGYGPVNPYYFNGKIDGVRIYNRVLSQSEILTLYNSGA